MNLRLNTHYLKAKAQVFVVLKAETGALSPFSVSVCEVLEFVFFSVRAVCSVTVIYVHVL